MSVKTIIDHRGVVQEATSFGEESTLTVSTPTAFTRGVNATLTALTQDVWYVDASTGDDAGDASSTSPLKTLSELYRRTCNRIIASTVTTFTINLSGDFGTELLTLRMITQAPTTIVRVIGTTTSLDTGSITTWQAETATTNTRRQLTDTSQDFTAYVGKRIRMTSGARNGLVTWIASLGAGATIANIGRFNWYQTGADPVSPDTYVIEDLTTKCGGYDINITGPTSATVTDWSPSIESVAFVNNTVFSSSRFVCTGTAVFRGCLFTGTTGSLTTSGGSPYFVSCCNDTIMSFELCTPTGYSFVHRRRVFFNRSVNAVWQQSTLHDGNGTNASMYIGGSSFVNSVGNHGFFNNVTDGTTYTAHVVVRPGGQWHMSAAAGVLWGNAGNTIANSIKIANGAGVTYVTLPVSTSNVAGEDVVLAAAAAIAWASLPALSVSPNNAFMNVYTT